MEHTIPIIEFNLFTPYLYAVVIDRLDEIEHFVTFPQ